MLKQLIFILVFALPIALNWITCKIIMKKTQTVLCVIMLAKIALEAKIIIVLNAQMDIDKIQIIYFKTSKNVLRNAQQEQT